MLLLIGMYLKSSDYWSVSFTAIFYRDCVLVSKMEVNHNTQLFRLQFPQGTIMHVPVGKHIYLKACIKGKQETVSRLEQTKQPETFKLFTNKK